MTNNYSTDFERASSQYLNRANGSLTNLDLSVNWTIACNVKLESATNNNFPFVMKRDSSGNNRSYGFYWTGSTGQTLNCLSSGNGILATEVTVAWNPSTATWYRIVVTKANTTVKFFVNGSQQGTTQTLASGGTTYNGSAPFRIGSEGPDSGEYMDGLLNDVRVWKRELSPTEVSDLYSDPCNFSNGSDLSGWWLTDNNANDASGNGNNLDNINSATFVTDVPFSCGGGAATPLRMLMGIGS